MGALTGLIGLGIGLVGVAVGVIVALSNRQIRQERIDHLEGLVDELRSEVTDRDRRHAQQVEQLKARCARLEGQVEVLTDGLGERIGARIADEVLAKLGSTG